MTLGRHALASAPGDEASCLVHVLRSAEAIPRPARAAGASTSRSATAPTTSRSPRALLRIPASTAFDYEWARCSTRSTAGSRRRSWCRTRSRPSGSRRYGATPAKLRRYPGLKEEYYLADFEPDPAVLGELGLDAARPLAVVRTPPAVSLYHRFENPLFAQVLERLRGEAQVVVLPRTPEQRAELAAAGGFIVPERAIDAQSLVAYADLVISAGGTMNREAVALGTPVWTTFEGRLGAVDERADRRRPAAPAALAPPTSRCASAASTGVRRTRVRRDPAVLTRASARQPLGASRAGRAN